MIEGRADWREVSVILLNIDPVESQIARTRLSILT
jgi:hypothetical protein